jgi:phosphohistidine phosphatase
MTKRLVLVRHGKSDWADHGITDFNRPLNHRGNKNAPEMAERLARKNLVPELIVSSPAKRALSTAKHFSEVWEMPLSDIREEKTIYEANVTALLKVINDLPDNFNMIALFGHNPGLTDLVNELAGAHIYNLPTAGIVVIDFPFESWSMVSRLTGNLFLFDCPKKIQAF